jgi:hypothetical protein
MAAPMRVRQDFIVSKAAALAFFKRATVGIAGFIIQPGVMYSKDRVQNGPGQQHGCHAKSTQAQILP